MKGPKPNFELRQKVVDCLKLGMTYGEVSRATGASTGLITKVKKIYGGVTPKPKKRSELRLSLEEREEISRRLLEGSTLRDIAKSLGRAPSTISREVGANGNRDNYRAWKAEQRFLDNLKRPRTAKLVLRPELQKEVQDRLKQKHSPRQISKRLMIEYPNNPDMHISHEAIYQSLFIQSRGALKRELAACLRTGRAVRKPRSRSSQRGRINNMVNISQRPAEIEDRAIPGHWEGDQIKGQNNASQIGTLVERNTRYVILLKLKDATAETMRDALTKAVVCLPEELFKTLTYDQGSEMAEHLKFSIDSNVDVYFCDPHSPWQRGSNENTNGLLRQYFPKSTPLSDFSQLELDAVARELNNRPRQTLGWMTPAEKLDEFLQTVALTG